LFAIANYLFSIMRMIRVCQTHLGCARHHIIVQSPKAYIRSLKKLKAAPHSLARQEP
jgi:hypothetical protein